MLRIEKNKIFYYPNETSKQYRNLSKIKGGIFRKMNDTVEIAENVTFGDFFKLLIKEKQIINLIFESSLYGVNFETFIQDFKKPLDVNKLNSSIREMGHLEIFWYVDYNSDYLLIEPAFHGTAKENVLDNPVKFLGLDFLSVYLLKDFPLKLDETVEIADNSRIREKNNIILKTKKAFTLYDIIQAILYELTWYGTPEMRNEQGKLILDEIRQIKTIDDVIEADNSMRYARIKTEKSFDENLSPNKQ